MRLIACGSRNFRVESGLITTVMQGIADSFSGLITVVHGDSGLADKEAGFQAERIDGLCPEPHTVNWYQACRPTCSASHRRPQGGSSICPAAGVYRNQEMLDTGIELVVAFSDRPITSGTADMIKRAKQAGVTVWVMGHG